jgi:enoyl-[acyl-carrier protein] reductase I
MHELGATVAIAHRPGRSDAAAALKSRSGAELALPVDTRDEASVAGALAEIERRWERLDFVLHTVVHVPEGLLSRPLLELRREDFRNVVDDAAYSLVVLARHAAPLLKRSTAPRLVTLSSSSSHRYTPSYHVAGIAKGALEACALYLAAELGPSGILCNVVSPSLLATAGAVRTLEPSSPSSPSSPSLNARSIAEGTRAHLAKKAPTRLPVEHADVADLVAFLCSPLCRNVTSEVITIDGGFSKNYF